VVARPAADGVVRLGLPEDFAAYRLPELLYDFKRARPTLRLDVRCGLSASLQRALEAGELDLALIKREAGLPGAIAAWPERLHWVTSRAHPIDLRQDPVPLAVAEQGCLYRNQVIHALEAAGRSWHIAYTSPNLHGIQAAVSAGLGISILSELGILADHRIIDAADGFPPLMKTELALVAGNNQSPTSRRLAELLVDFCGSIRTRGKAAAVA
jgi:DNA-binding transcriptional LysR family regulator